MPIQKGVGFNVAMKKMTMDAQATVEDVKQKWMKTNTKYKEVVDIHCVAKVFKEGNKVMVLFHNKRFLVGSYSKLQQKKYGLYIVLTKISDNVYVIDLPDNMSISRTFNVSYIYYFYDDQPLYPKLRDDSTSLLQVEGLARSVSQLHL